MDQNLSDVTPCRAANSHRRFGKVLFLHLDAPKRR